MSGTVHEKIFARYYDDWMEKSERKISRFRERSLKGLSGTILEPGAGTGINFPFYSKDAQVYALEPSVPMFEKGEQRIRESRAKIKMIRASFEELPDLDIPQQYDAIVVTLLLCTVANLHQTIELLSKALKPGGKLILIEHIRSSHPFGRALQNIFNAPWKSLALGCNLNRNTDEVLKQYFQDPVEEVYFDFGFPFYFAIFRKNQ